MANKLYEEASVQDIADAIREKNGSSNTYLISEMGDAVRAIKNGINTSDATAIAAHILENDTAYVDGEKIVGTMPNNGDVSRSFDGLNPSTSKITIPEGYTIGGTISLTDDIKNRLREWLINNGWSMIENLTTTVESLLLFLEDTVAQDPEILTALQAVIMGNTTTTTLPDSVTSIRSYGFYKNTKLTDLEANGVTSVGQYAFQDCTALTSISLSDNLTSINAYVFRGCSALSTFKSNSTKLTNIVSNAFYNCTALQKVDLMTASTIASQAFQGCTNLHILILRKTSGVVTLGGTSAFTGTAIASGSGYIYVPSALVSTYKSATNWSAYSAQIRAIEDYPGVCG